MCLYRRTDGVRGGEEDGRERTNSRELKFQVELHFQSPHKALEELADSWEARREEK